ncbi:MAG TPA: hypothetical protein PKI62_15995, partial [bacterium]|nr:hypothetical protein [bacterium]
MNDSDQDRLSLTRTRSHEENQKKVVLSWCLGGFVRGLIFSLYIFVFLVAWRLCERPDFFTVHFCFPG